MTTSHIQSNCQKATLMSGKNLVELAADGLTQMLDPVSQLFCYRLRRTPNGLMREGISQRYTAITLMGLHRLRESGTASPIDFGRVLESLLADLKWVDNIGDLGLLLWLCALTEPARLGELTVRVGFETALNRYSDALQGKTMELSWFLAGLSHWALAQPEKTPELKQLAFDTFIRLRNNQVKGAFFGHQAQTKSVVGRLRWWAGSFADQTYPIYAMTKFSQVWPDTEAQKRAIDCAMAICHAQGPLGQWWWHYDASKIKIGVMEGYPVFSVHQHGMAPMVLFELGEAIQHDFAPWICKGLEWVGAQNELAFSMVDASANVIWRCIYRSSLLRYWDFAFTRYEWSQEQRLLKDLRVLFECRPYELGWLLYAFAGR